MYHHRQLSITTHKIHFCCAIYHLDYSAAALDNLPWFSILVNFAQTHPLTKLFSVFNLPRNKTICQHTIISLCRIKFERTPQIHSDSGKSILHKIFSRGSSCIIIGSSQLPCTKYIILQYTICLPSGVQYDARCTEPQPVAHRLLQSSSWPIHIEWLDV